MIRSIDYGSAATAGPPLSRASLCPKVQRTPQSQAELVALSRPFAAVTVLLISAASGASWSGVGDSGSPLTVVERLETDDFSALVSSGKSCFAELTTAFALLCTF
jgi:hypothetical protein